MNPNAVPETQETVQETARQVPTQRDFGPPTREQREQLKALSTEIFGKSSRYQKLYEYDQVLTRKIKETVPGENGEPDKEEENEVPLMVGPGKGSKQSVRRYRTTEEVLQLMLDFKAKREEFMRQMEEQKAAAKAKKDADDAAKKVQEELGGSALT